MRSNRIRLALIVCVAVAAWAVAPASAAPPGSPQPSFGDGGVVRVDPDPAENNAWDEIALDERGRTVVLTRSREEHGVLLRLLPDGSPDPGFGGGGRVPLPGGPWRGLALQPDGRIVVAGAIAREMALMRFAESGGPDPSFGADGIVTAPFDSPRRLSQGQELLAEFVDLLVRPDGGIVALGTMRPCQPAPEKWCQRFAAVLAGFHPDGRVDESFGDDGAVMMPGPQSYGPLETLQTLDVLAPRDGGGVLVGGDLAGRIAVFGFDAGGSLDHSWNSDGIFSSEFETYEGEEGIGAHAGEVRDLLLRPDGRVVVVGDFSVLGLLADGQPDPRFGRTRTYTRGWGEEVELGDGVLDSKGRLLIAGEWNHRSAVIRMLPDGSFDPRFSGDGLAALDLAPWNRGEGVAEGTTGIALRADGGLLAAGFAYPSRKSKRAELTLFELANGDGRLLSCHGQPAKVQGTPGDDRLSGEGPIVGLGGDDEIRSYGGPICAGPGDDEIVDHEGGLVDAGAGDDLISGGRGGTVHGGPGDDRLEPDQGGRDRLYGDGGADRLVGGGGRDRLVGGSGADLLKGGGGVDSLWGGAGDDILLGGAGSDRLFGGLGRNQLRPGAASAPKGVYLARRPGLKIRLRVEGGAIVAGSIRVPMRCGEGGRRVGGVDFHGIVVPIHPDGSFRDHTDSDVGIGVESSELRGVVGEDAIRGDYRSWERYETWCATGRRGDLAVDFVARRVRDD
jgi:uncharacterized delta-60 repeat protein